MRRGRRSLAAVCAAAALMAAAATRAAADDATPAGNATPAADTAPVKVATSVEPKRVTIGTPFRYTIRVEAKGDVELFVPLLAKQIGDFVIRDFGQVPHAKTDGGRVVDERWYELVAYQSGDLTIPGPTVQYRVSGSDMQRVDAPDALIIVESLLPKGGTEKAELRDVKAPATVPKDYTPLLWILAGSAVLFGAAYGLTRWLGGSRKQAIAVPRPPQEVALEALARLRSARLLELGRHEEYYVRLSSIIRVYLEGRFQLRAPEMTTEEFLQAAQRAPQLTPAQRAELVPFLTEADLVKFARHVPSADDAERAYAAARHFIESTAPTFQGGDRAAA